MATTVYDTIGQGYARQRRPDANRRSTDLRARRCAVGAQRGYLPQFAEAGAEAGLARLAVDIASGSWHSRHGHLLAADTLDVGYRLVVARLPERETP